MTQNSAAPDKPKGGLTKRQIGGAIVVILPIVISLFTAYFAYSDNWVNINQNEATISYQFTNQPSTITQPSNTIDVYCSNAEGHMKGEFNLIVTFVNATFSTQTAQPFEQLSDSKVLLYYVLNGGSQSNKALYYNINQNTVGFSVQLSIQDISSHMTSSIYSSSLLQYNYELQTKSYVLNIGSASAPIPEPTGATPAPGATPTSTPPPVGTSPEDYIAVPVAIVIVGLIIGMGAYLLIFRKKP